ncbi:hypothetical protein SEA_CUEYLYSS_43 [Mycobacterium phage Cueylyss]|nr:hypothetical protein SEA_CUEYLYSS_43 [Mycobacterium phage Cueylyss]
MSGMSKHEYVGGFTADPEQFAHLWVQGHLARRLGLTHVRESVSGRHRLPDGLSNIPYGTVIWSWSADAWIRRIKPEGKYPRNFTVVATAEEAAGLRRLK